METSKNLIWIDMEMTGLNVEKDKILEIALIVTDSELNILDESIDVVINQSNEVLNNMNDWCKEHLGQNGLTEKSRNSTITLQDAGKLIYKIIRKYTDEKQGLLCGNSVYVDRKYLAKFFPKIEKYLNYRIIDVSSIKEIARRWYPDIVKDFLEHKKIDLTHRALDDIKWSINELKFYREKIFR